MDRCRCEEYAAAVKKLKFFTLGTHPPHIIDNYDRSQYVTAWQKNAVTLVDLRFKKPMVWKKLAPGEQPKDRLTERSQEINEMWCPYMTLVKRQPYESS